MSRAGYDHFISTQNVHSRHKPGSEDEHAEFRYFFIAYICGSAVFLKRILAEMVVDEIVIMLSYSAKNFENRGFFSTQSYVL